MKKILFLFSSLFFIYSQCLAQCMLSPVSLNQRVSQSSTIIEGKVIDQKSFWDQGQANIYTSNLIEVYKTFKNTAPSYIEVITEGGTVGNDRELVEPSLGLSVGKVGIFTLNQNQMPSQFGEQVFEAYASAQGFINYNIQENTADEPFKKYTNISSSIYGEIQQYTGSPYLTIKNTNVFYTTPSANKTTAATILSFSPTTITAGTFSVLTINGSGFGTTQGTSFVEFKRADDGGATFCTPDPTAYVSWSDTQIQVKLTTTGASTANSTPGTGVIRVDVAGVKSTSTGTLTVSHAQLNVYSSTAPATIYNTRHVSKQSGGYVWQMFTGFDSNAAAKSSFLRAFQSWRCGTYINWSAGATTTVNVIANDGVNVIRFDIGTELPAGVLGRCSSRWSGCGTNPSQNWYVNELDIVFDDATNWNYGPAAPAFAQYDFESVAVHELGHGHQLGHVINSAEIMNFSISNGQSKRTLSTNDLAGGNAVMARNLSGIICAQTMMTALTSSNCALGAPTASFTANRTVVCPTQTVSFTDQSTGNPTSWSWIFAGGTPSVSTVQSPTVTYNSAGTYSVQLIATNTNGSSTYSVLGYINVTNVSSLPLVQDFQGSFSPANWYLDDSGNDNVKWAKALNAGALTTTNSAVFDNFTTNVTGTRDALKTFVNLSGFSSAKMTFYRAYGQTFGTPNIDSLEIRVSTDCNSTSTQALYKGGSQISTGTGNGTTLFVPTAAQWAKDSIDLSAYVGQSNVMVSFINRSHFGDGIYIDQVNITGIAAISPTAAISSATTGCTGTSITLTDASTGSPTSWLWTMAGGAPSTSTLQNTAVTYSTVGVKTVTLTVSSGTVTSSAVQTITITATPTVSPSFTATSICLNSSATLNVTGATTYTWLPTGTGTVSVLSPTATTVYSITGSTSGCTSAIKTVTVTVNPLPTTTASTSGTLTCSTITVGLNSTLAGMNYTWTAPAGATVTNSNIQNTSGTGPGIYSLTVVNPTTSCTYSTTTSVSQNTIAPSVVGTTTGTLTCSTLTTSVIATTSMTPVSYSWSGVGILSGSTTGTIVVNQPGAFNYTVTNSSNGCKTIGSQNVTQDASTPTVTTSGSQTITCAVPTVTISGTASPSTCTPVWTGGVSSGANSYTATASSANIYTLTVTNPANGCTNSGTTSVTSSAGVPIITTSVTNSLTCTSLTAQVIATTTSSPVSYNWSGPGITSGATTASATVNSGGQYTVVVTNTVSGCSSMVTVSVTQNTVIPSVTGTTSGSLTCTTFTVNANATTTTSPVSYNWTGTGITAGASTGTITVNQAGTFNYTVTNTSNGCMSTGIRTVTQNTTSPVVTGSASGTLTCLTATANANATTSTTPVSYNWSGAGILSGSATGTITVNQPGTYNYTVTNTTNGCATNGSLVVSQNTATPIVTGSTTGTLTCITVTTTANATTSMTPVSYNWSGTGILSGSATGTITVNQPGTFNYTVTNTSSGCTSIGSRTVTQNTVTPTMTLTPLSSSMCAGTSTVLSVQTASANSVFWNTGATTTTISVTPTVTSNYSVTVTNPINGCSAMSIATINVVSTPTLSSSITNTIICSGTPVIVSVTGASSYTWFPSGSGNTSTLTPTSTTVYTVTGSNGSCIGAPVNFTINVTTTPTVVITASSSTICAGQTATLNASGASSYSWAPGGQTSPVITVNPTGTNTYTVTGINGSCSSTKTITINVSTTPTVVASITNTTVCSGTSVLVSVTGASSYTWLPSGSGNTSTLNPSSTTVYTVTGSNGNCSGAPVNFTINVTTTPTVGITASSTTLCAGQTSTLNASGASTFSWVPGGQTAPVITVNPTSTTTYTVTGYNGSCSSSKTITINVTSTPSVVASITNTSVCSGTSVIVSATGASSYTWLPSGSGNTSTLTPNSTTVYTVTGSNGNCIGAPVDFTINVTTTPTVGITASSTTLCAGQTSTLNASGASTFSWAPGGETTPVITVNPTGTTTYTVTGFNGSCSSSKTITINVNATPTVFSSITNTTICSGTSVFVAVTGASSYTWSPTGSGTGSNLTPTTTTIYTVTGSNGSCVSNPQTFTINVSSNPILTNTITNVTCFSLCNGAMTVTASGGNAPYSYSLIQGAPVCAATTCSNLCAGAYTLNATDANGCSANSTIVINQPSQITAVTSNTNASCSGCSDGAVSVFASGGTPGYVYTWMPGAQTTSQVNGLPVGCYTVQIIDNNGCSTTATTCISFGTGITSVQSGNINLILFPNPSKGFFTISNTTTTDKFDVTIFNTLGQTIKTETGRNINEMTFDLSKYSRGVYYAKITTDEGTKLFKLILE